ncbi:MAG: FG-GAP-like repeat-containing protein [Bryobacteraceae bacterium]
MTREEVQKALDKYCPGISDRLLQAPIGTSVRNSTSPAPTSGQASLFQAIADFDGDGNPDVAGVDNNIVTVSLLNTDFSSRSISIYRSGPSLTYIVAGDFNGDGRPDLVAAGGPSTPGGTASILLNSGGVFLAPQVLSGGGTSPSALATGDFNGDSKLDLAVGTSTGVSILLGNGNGTFQSATSYPTGTIPSSILVDDFTGDGKLDVVIFNAGQNAISVLRGTGSGVFFPVVASPGGYSPNNYLGYMVYSDLNHDGKLDVVIRYGFWDVLSVLLGNGDGSFQPARDYVAPPNNDSLAIVPLDDGRFLVFMRDGVTHDQIIMIAPGDGTIGAPTFIPTSGSSAIAAGDLNGDSRADLVLGSNGQAIVRINDGSGFPAPVPYTLPGTPASLAMADVNKDGKLDLVAALSNGTIGVLLGSATGTLGPVTTVAAGSKPANLVFSDFNGDGKLDIAASQADSTSIYVLLGNGSGGFQSPTVLTNTAFGGGLNLTVATGDFNSDQRPDLAVVAPLSDYFGAGTALIYLGRGDGTFNSPAQTSVPTIGGAAFGDFNRDGKLDMAVSQIADGQMSVLLGRGDGTFGAPKFFPINSGGTDLQAADLNGDGILDLLDSGCCGATSVTYLLGNGDGTFQAEKSLVSGKDTARSVLADFNGDGRPDVAFADSRYVTVQSFGFPLIQVTSAAAPFYRISPDSIATIYGPALTNPALNGTKVTVKDANGTSRDSTLFYVSKGQINFAVPAGTTVGTSQVKVTAPNGTTTFTNVVTAPVVPALFALNAGALVAANLVRVSNGVTTYEPVYQVSAGAVIAKPIDFGPAGDQLYLVLYGTGLRAAGTAGVTVSIAGATVPVLYAGPQGEVEGFDQVNIQLPRTLIGKGNVSIDLTAKGVSGNTTQLTIK